MWIASLGSRGVETGSVAIEGEPLGYCRSGGQGRTDANGACAELVQGAYGRLAPPFESERRESVQTGFEERSATRWWSDSQRSLVCRQTLCRTGRHTEFGTPRSSSRWRPPLPRMWRRTRTDPVSTRPRFRANDGTLYRMQAEPQRSGQ